MTVYTRRNMKKRIVLAINYILYRFLTTYRLWSPMLRFVHDNIKLYNVRERRVHLSEPSPICSRFCTKRSLYFVNVLRLSCTTRCLGVLSRGVVTTLYHVCTVYSLVLRLSCTTRCLGALSRGVVTTLYHVCTVYSLVLAIAEYENKWLYVFNFHSP